MNSSRLQNLLLYKYRYAAAYTIMVGAALYALFYKLGSLLGGPSSVEAQQGTLISETATAVFDQGIYLPYNVIQSVSIDLFGTTSFALRLPSVFFGMLTLAMLFYVVHLWHREKIAIITILFLSTSSWFLTFARLGLPYIFEAFSLVLILLAATLIRHSEKPRLALVFASLAIPIALYSPYMIYFVILYLVLYRNEIRHIVTHTNNSQLITGLVTGIILLSPLLFGFVTNLDNFKLWLGFDLSGLVLSELPKNILNTIQHILLQSDPNASLHLGRLPMLDIFTATMTALGLYHYEHHFNLLRTRFVVYGFGVGILAMAFTRDEGHYFLLAPLVYILAATGIVTLLNQWNKIFPRNPFARTLALVPISFAILITSQYHLDRYFLAWAQSPDTRRIYATEPADLREKISRSEHERILVLSSPDEMPMVNFLLGDGLDRRITVNSIEQTPSINNIKEEYTEVYLDSEYEGPLRAELNAYSSSRLQSDRASQPVAYRVYNLSISRE